MKGLDDLARRVEDLVFPVHELMQSIFYNNLPWPWHKALALRFRPRSIGVVHKYLLRAADHDKIRERCVSKSVPQHRIHGTSAEARAALDVTYFVAWRMLVRSKVSARIPQDEEKDGEESICRNLYLKRSVICA